MKFSLRENWRLSSHSFVLWSWRGCAWLSQTVSQIVFGFDFLIQQKERKCRRHMWSRLSNQWQKFGYLTTPSSLELNRRLMPLKQVYLSKVNFNYVSRSRHLSRVIALGYFNLMDHLLLKPYVQLCWSVLYCNVSLKWEIYFASLRGALPAQRDHSHGPDYLLKQRVNWTVTQMSNIFARQRGFFHQFPFTLAPSVLISLPSYIKTVKTV